jgi:O-methyltransferase
MIRLAVTLLRPFVPFLTRIAKDPLVRYHPLLRALQPTPHQQMMDRAIYFAKTSRLEGDYLEFGVWQGESLISAYYHAQHYGLKKMQFFGFDCFEGLPTPQGIDAQGFVHFSEGQYACSLEEVRRRLTKARVDFSRVHLIPGRFEDTLSTTSSNLPTGKAAVVLIDCDLYASTVPVLEFITDRIQDGTLLMLDDWFAYRADPERGQQRAFREWLQRHPEITASPYHTFALCGMSFILHRKDAP